MKYYLVTYLDLYYPGNYGIIPIFYESKEEAEKAADWYEKHPDPDQNWLCRVQVMNRVESNFVPPMTEEEYDQYLEDYYYPSSESDQFDEDLYD